MVVKIDGTCLTKLAKKLNLPIVYYKDKIGMPVYMKGLDGWYIGKVMLNRQFDLFPIVNIELEDGSTHAKIFGWQLIPVKIVNGIKLERIMKWS